MIEGTVWKSGRNKTLQESFAQELEPINANFLVFDTDRSGISHFVSTERGEVAQHGVLMSVDRIPNLVLRCYFESVRNACPLVVVIEEPAWSPSSKKLAARKRITETIYTIKQSKANKHVTIPKLLTLNKPEIDANLFGSNRLSAGQLSVEEQTGAEEVLGVRLGANTKLARIVCIAHGLSRSRLGAKVCAI